jgi:endonuclease/exonuclease/phosphatase family metal-dependent hydrolase
MENSQKQIVLQNFYSLNENNNFQITKKNIHNSLIICSYNVHGWLNLEQNIKPLDNFYNILNLFKQVDPDILILQEVSPLASKNFKFIYAEFCKIGFHYHFSVPNGEIKNNFDSFITILSKKPIQEKYKIDLSVTKLLRYVPVVKIQNIFIAGIHFEIGFRYHHLNEKNSERKKLIFENEQLRKKQIEKLLSKFKNLDILVGDFNFQPTDNEFSLISENFCYFQNYSNSNPFNRSDMFFIRKNNNIHSLTFYTLKCNYSDHLPIINQIYKS